MIRNYLKTAFRHFYKSKSYSFINIAGLSTGLCCCLLLGLYIRNELGYDSFHEKADRISLFTQWEDNAGTGSGFAKILRSEISQVESIARIMPVKALVGLAGNAYYEDNFCFADSTIFNIFTIRIAEGNRVTSLGTQYGVMISRRIVNKYFPTEDPMGKVIRFNNSHELTITGVFENLPAASHINIDFLCNAVHASELLNENLRSYWDGRSLTYVLFSSGNVNEQIQRRLSVVAQKTEDQGAGIWKLSFIPLREIYLYAQLHGKVRAPEAIQEVYIASAIAFFILLLAGFNYINLSTARSTLRGREVGVRKALGADRASLMMQFLGESGIYIVVALTLAFIAAIALLPWFNSIAATQLDIASFDIQIALIFIAGLIVLTLLTGTYPAIVLSAFKPVAILKGDVMKMSSKGYFRKIIVVGQFAVSLVMIFATLVVFKQINFIRHKDLGYQTSQILTLAFPDVIAMEQRFVLKNELSRVTAIESVSLCNSLPGNGAGREKLLTELVPEAMKDQGSGINHVQADEDFIRTFGITLKEGKDFRGVTPGNLVFLVNESAVKYFGWDHAEGKELGYYTYEYTSATGYREVPIHGEVIGVIKDYHQADLKNKIQPMMISFNTNWLSNMAVKIDAGKISAGVTAVEQQWKKLFPDIPFDYEFLDDSFDQTYKKEESTGKVFGIFSALAIAVSSLGLFGLSSFTVQQKTHEIGVRKVFGASSSTIAMMLSKDYVKLVLISNVIAIPVAWIAMDRWLQIFSYQIRMDSTIFLFPGIFSFIVAVLTVGGQALKASRVSPAKTLRDQ